MLVYTTTKKRALRLAMLLLILLIGIAIGVAAILTSVRGSAAEKKVPVYCVDRGDNKISLTFDCAWGNSNTEELLKILEKENVKATFFVTGEFCDNYPNDIKKLFEAGHEIENHSDKHPHVEGININKLIEDTKECNRKIQMLTKKKPSLYRSPYGEYDDNVITTIEGMGLMPVQWSVDSIDWQQPSSETIIKRVCDNTVSGSILLFHNDLENTTKALPTVLSNLKKKGFEFVPASELLYKDSYHIDSTGKQIHDVNVSESAFITYTNNSYANEAIDIIRSNFTLEEIEAFSNLGITTISQQIEPFLSKEQIAALFSLSEEELAQVVADLIAVKKAELPEVIEQAFPPEAELLDTYKNYKADKQLPSETTVTTTEETTATSVSSAVPSSLEQYRAELEAANININEIIAREEK